jgi:hypothetical protein
MLSSVTFERAGAAVAIAVGAGLASAAQFPSGPPALSETYVGFTFVSGDCGLGPEYCAIRQPKDWTSADREVVERAIDAVAARRGGRAIAERAQARGFQTLRRYAFGGTRDANGTPVPLPGAEAQTHRSAEATSIDFNDRFFRWGALRDQFSGAPGYLVAAKIFLHECFHAIDEWSHTDEFAKTVGFVRSASGEWQIPAFFDTQEEQNSYTRLMAQIPELDRLDGVEDLWQLSRRLALRMKPVRLPAMLAGRSPSEAFAEIGAHLIMDDRARSYLPPDVVAFFDSRVLR